MQKNTGALSTLVISVTCDWVKNRVKNHVAARSGSHAIIHVTLNFHTCWHIHLLFLCQQNRKTNRETHRKSIKTFLMNKFENLALFVISAFRPLNQKWVCHADHQLWTDFHPLYPNLTHFGTVCCAMLQLTPKSNSVFVVCKKGRYEVQKSIGSLPVCK